MTWSFNANSMGPYQINHHQQDTNYYCGAATAQMILDSIGAGLLDQDVLYTSNHDHNSQPGWCTDPDGLAYTLRHYRPASFTNTFVLYCKSTEVEGSHKIVDTLYNYKVATGTLVYGCRHWIAVIGIQTDVEPSGAYSINGFWINNPWPYAPSFDNPTLAPPPPHSNTDGCGSGGNRGVENEWVSYSDWQSTYFRGCNWRGSKEYISVCDPIPPKIGELRMKKIEYFAKGDRIIHPKEILEFSLKSIKEYNLQQDKRFAEAFEGTTPERPQLVQRLDRPNEFYYIIPFLKGKREISVVAKMDALFGNILGAKVLTKPLEKLIISQDVVKEKVIGQNIELGKRMGKLKVHPEAYCLYPTLVWKPCYESRSPYYPFYMITVGSHQIYIGYDGKIYPELHDFGPGG
ncbi:hypothetical protein ES702_02292 [subsurface metagenome]